MGILSTLFGKGSKAEIKQTPATPVEDIARPPLLPTVNASAKRLACYNEAFCGQMASLGCFSEKEIAEMLSKIEGYQNYLSNQSQWQDNLYAEYFKQRIWTWQLLENWRERLIDDNPYADWYYRETCKQCSYDMATGILALCDDCYFNTVTQNLKKEQLQNILALAGKKTDGKGTNDELSKKLKDGIKLDWLESECSDWQTASAKVERTKDYKRKEYQILLDHITAVAEISYSIFTAKEGGISVCHYMFVGGLYWSDSLAREVIKKEPGKVPPLYPGDNTKLRPDLASYNNEGKPLELRVKDGD